MSASLGKPCWVLLWLNSLNQLNDENMEASFASNLQGWGFDPLLFVHEVCIFSLCLRVFRRVINYAVVPCDELAPHPGCPLSYASSLLEYITGSLWRYVGYISNALKYTKYIKKKFSMQNCVNYFMMWFITC